MPNKYTTGEVGQLLGLTRQTILRRINKGLIPCYRDPHSGYYYVLRTDVEEYARKHNLPLFPLKGEAHLSEQVRSKAGEAHLIESKPTSPEQVGFMAVRSKTASEQYHEPQN